MELKSVEDTSWLQLFIKNSRSHLFTATLSASTCKMLQPTRAYLIPKLRYKFAEFLLQSSLKRLRILILPTCVGLRYGFNLTEA